jgi:intein/homing endonuclease
MVDMIYWTKEEISWLIENYPKLLVRDCASHLKRSMPSIYVKARKLGLKSWYGGKYDVESLTKAMVDLSRPETCYLLGLIWADGCLVKSRENGVPKYRNVALAMVKEDLDGISWVFDKIGKMSKTHVDPSNPRWKKVTRYTIHSTKLAKKLIEYDFHIKSQASPSKIMRDMPKDNVHHFLRGWMDGDGCWSLKRERSAVWSLAGTRDQDWSSIEEILNDMDIRYQIIKYRAKGSLKGGGSVISVRSIVDIARLGSYVYCGFNGMGLERKYRMYLEIKRRADIVGKDREKREREVEMFAGKEIPKQKDIAKALEVGWWEANTIRKRIIYQRDHAHPRKIPKVRSYEHAERGDWL